MTCNVLHFCKKFAGEKTDLRFDGKGNLAAIDENRDNVEVVFFVTCTLAPFEEHLLFDLRDTWQVIHHKQGTQFEMGLRLKSTAVVTS